MSNNANVSSFFLMFSCTGSVSRWIHVFAVGNLAESVQENTTDGEMEYPSGASIREPVTNCRMSSNDRDLSAVYPLQMHSNNISVNVQIYRLNRLL